MHSLPDQLCVYVAFLNRLRNVLVAGIHVYSTLCSWIIPALHLHRKSPTASYAYMEVVVSNGDQSHKWLAYQSNPNYSPTLPDLVYIDCIHYYGFIQVLSSLSSQWMHQPGLVNHHSLPQRQSLYYSYDVQGISSVHTEWAVIMFCILMLLTAVLCVLTAGNI